MKTSKKIILVVASFILVYLAIGMLTLRSNIISFFQNIANTRQEVAVENFHSLFFSSNWNVKIKQGSKYKVELPKNQDPNLIPHLKNIDGTLYFNAELQDSFVHNNLIEAKIIVPSLKQIQAKKGTKIHLENFKSDTINIILNGNEFTGKNNHFAQLNFNTSGNSKFQLTQSQE